jgi:adenosylcobinamide kinase/adenosylcobinamide-phosphate guanylyltransferase
MARIIYISGGARSGKSTFAEQKTCEFGTSVTYLATAQTLDSEMAERVQLHRERRGAGWHTVEEPLAVAQALRECDGSSSAILFDCLTLWLSNLLFAHEGLGEQRTERIQQEISQLKETLAAMTTPVILVSNEVGMGIVPENALARLFRDRAGSLNQQLAALADEAYVVISGIPLRLK